MVGCKSTVYGRRITIQDKIFGKDKNYFISFINDTLNISYREEGDENQGNEKNLKNWLKNKISKTANNSRHNSGDKFEELTEK